MIGNENKIYIHTKAFLADKTMYVLTLINGKAETDDPDFAAFTDTFHFEEEGAQGQVPSSSDLAPATTTP